MACGLAGAVSTYFTCYDDERSRAYGHGKTSARAGRQTKLFLNVGRITGAGARRAWLRTAAFCLFHLKAHYSRLAVDLEAATAALFQRHSANYA